MKVLSITLGALCFAISAAQAYLSSSTIEERQSRDKHESDVRDTQRFEYDYDSRAPTPSERELLDALSRHYYTSPTHRRALYDQDGISTSLRQYESESGADLEDLEARYWDLVVSVKTMSKDGKPIRGQLPGLISSETTVGALKDLLKQNHGYSPPNGVLYDRIGKTLGDEMHIASYHAMDQNLYLQDFPPPKRARRPPSP